MMPVAMASRSVIAATALHVLLVVCTPYLVEGQLADNNTPTGDGCFCFQPFAEEFSLKNPVIFKQVPDGSGRVVVGEQTGIIYLYNPSGSQRDMVPFLDLMDGVTLSLSLDERGLLGLAFHPRFAVNHRLFVIYTIESGRGLLARLSQFQTGPTPPDKVDTSTERVLLEMEQPFKNHNGGELFFDFDGYLMMFTGDGGGAGDVSGNAQNKSSLLGKALRIDVDTLDGAGPDGRPYGIPNDNPFVADPDFRPEVFAYGFRNPWRCDIDSGDPLNNDEGRGRIFCGDVGQGAVEEVDLVESGGNYGWNIKEGFDCYNQEDCGPIENERLPIYTYTHEVGKSIIGGHVYRGCRSPALNGRYIYGDFDSGKIYYLEETVPGTWRNAEMEWCRASLCMDGLVNNKSNFILSFGKDADGEVYVLTTELLNPNHPGGHIYKIVDPLRPGDPSTCHSHNGAVPMVWCQASPAVVILTLLIITLLTF